MYTKNSVNNYYLSVYTFCIMKEKYNSLYKIVVDINGLTSLKMVRQTLHMKKEVDD